MPFLDNRRWYEIPGTQSASPGNEKRPAIFLDRDGVVIHEKHYLRDPEQVELYPGVADKLEFFFKSGIPVILVTNQSAIGQGFLDWNTFAAIQARMSALCGLEQPFSAVFANSYIADDKDADWRKPNSGMLLHAAQEMGLDLNSSIIVGDKVSDLESGRRAGVKYLVHVMTGYGESHRSEVGRRFPDARSIASLAELDISGFPEFSRYLAAKS